MSLSKNKLLLNVLGFFLLFLVYMYSDEEHLVLHECLGAAPKFV